MASYIQKPKEREHGAQSNRPKPISSSDSSFSSSFSAFFSSSAGASGAAPPPLAVPAGAAAAPPPDPTLSRISFTFLPSSAYAGRQSSSQSHALLSVLNAHLRKKSSPYWFDVFDVGTFDQSQEFVRLCTCQRRPEPKQKPTLTVMPISSSARMRAAYEAASSELDIARLCVAE